MYCLFLFPFCYFLKPSFFLLFTYLASYLFVPSTRFTLMTLVSFVGSELVLFNHTFYLSKYWYLCFPRLYIVHCTSSNHNLRIFNTNLRSRDEIRAASRALNPPCIPLTPFVRREYLRRPGHTPLIPSAPSTSCTVAPSPHLEAASPPQSPSHGSSGVTPGQLRKVY